MSGAKFTPGPWQVVVTEHPHHLGGKHVERRIFTTWTHPQLKSPYPVVNGMVGIGAEKESPARHMVHLEEEDARLIAAAPQLLEALEGLMELEKRGRIMPIGREWDAARAAIKAAKGEA